MSETYVYFFSVVSDSVLEKYANPGWRILLKSFLLKGNPFSSPDTTSFELDGNDTRYLFGEIDGSGASVSFPIKLLAGCPYVTLKIFSPFLFLPVIWFDSWPLILLAGV